MTDNQTPDTKIAILEVRVSALTTEVADMENKLDVLENRTTIVEQKLAAVTVKWGAMLAIMVFAGQEALKFLFSLVSSGIKH